MQQETQVETTDSAVDAVAAVESDGSIEKHSGDSAVSFDELEAVNTYKEKEVVAKAKENLEVKKAEKKLKEQASDKKGKGKTEAKAKAETETETETQDDGVLENKEPVKMFKVKAGDDTIELASDSVHTVKVDGKPTKVTYQDLVNDYAGKEAVKQRFDEYSKKNQDLIQEKNGLVQEREYLTTTVSDLVNELKTSPAEGLATLAELGGQSGTEFTKQFFENLIPLVKQWSSFSDDEKQFYEEKLQVEKEKKSLEKNKKTYERDKTNAELQREIDTFKTRFTIDDQEFSDTFFELEGLQKEGKIEGIITPELVAGAVVDKRLETRVVNIVESVRPTLVEDYDAIDDIMDVISEYDTDATFTDDDIKDIIAQSFPVGDPDVEDESKLSKKVRSSPKTEAKDVKDPSNEPINFDDL